MKKKGIYFKVPLYNSLGSCSTGREMKHPPGRLRQSEAIISHFSWYPWKRLKLQSVPAWVGGCGNTCWFQLLWSEDLMVFFVVHANKLNISRLWSVGWTKQDIWRHELRLWEIITHVFFVSDNPMKALVTYQVPRRIHIKTTSTKMTQRWEGVVEGSAVYTLCETGATVCLSVLQQPAANSQDNGGVA